MILVAVLRRQAAVEMRDGRSDPVVLHLIEWYTGYIRYRRSVSTQPTPWWAGLDQYGNPRLVR